ncbi:MAG: helix-turn-helix domain-containing protein [Acholeplasmataceae bacterium]|nr:helix-turn-helix domain-containing protein [Acholeplasmataceae bacterium]
MGRRSNTSKETKLLAIRLYQSGESSIEDIATKLGVSRTAFRRWLSHYAFEGESALEDKPRNQSYSQAFKLEVIQAYLNDEGSYMELTGRYHVPSHQTIRNWVMKYNGHEEIKPYDPRGHVYMAKTRKVSQEEKIEIVRWTIENGSQYKLAAQKYETSYAQVYNWVKKYKALGEEGLQDRRGRHKLEEELTEIERLYRENEHLRRRNARLELEAEVLKKAEETERRDRLERLGKKPPTKR